MAVHVVLTVVWQLKVKSSYTKLTVPLADVELLNVPLRVNLDEDVLKLLLLIVTGDPKVVVPAVTVAPQAVAL